METKKTIRVKDGKSEDDSALQKKEEAENSIDLLKYAKMDIIGDQLNFALLTFLYFIQGAVAGLMMAVPFILQKRHITFKEQAAFHLATYSISFKILWVPLVDSWLLGGEGRRKLVVIMMQYLIGIFLWVVSINVDDYLGTDKGARPDITMLTVTFFLCGVFSSIQDVALDGWSLTIFQRKSKAYLASCRAFGVSLGLIIIFPSFINLESSYFSDQLRSLFGLPTQKTGLVDFQSFTLFLSVSFLIITTLILKFKEEKNDEDIEFDLSKADKDRHEDVKETYTHLWSILKLKPIQMMMIFILTWHIGFGPINNVVPLRLLDHGVPRGKLSFLTVCGIPLQLCLPFLLNRYVTRPQPVRIFVIAYILRLISNVFYFGLIVLITRQGRETTKEGHWYYVPLIIIFNCDNVAVFAMIMAMVTLFTRICDHKFGNAFMTLMNSLNNFGGSWPSTASLWIMDIVTIKACPKEDSSCSNILIDGIYIEIAFCTLFGALWIFWAKRHISQLERTDVALVHSISINSGTQENSPSLHSTRVSDRKSNV